MPDKSLAAIGAYMRIGGGGVTAAAVASVMLISDTQAHVILRKLVSTGIAEMSADVDGILGRPAYRYTLNLNRAAAVYVLNDENLEQLAVDAALELIRYRAWRNSRQWGKK